MRWSNSRLSIHRIGHDTLSKCMPYCSNCSRFPFIFYYVFIQENDQLMTRRYNYIRYNSGMLIGQPQFCRYEVKLKSWIRWFVSCSYCFCYCDHENQFSDRFFSLLEAKSNIEENKYEVSIKQSNTPFDKKKNNNNHISIVLSAEL